MSPAEWVQTKRPYEKVSKQSKAKQKKG
jgi:hypothetical protein